MLCVTDRHRLASFYSIERHAHLDFDAENALPEQNVSYSIVNEIPSRLARVNHKSIGEFHGLGTCSTKLARNDDFATFGARLHDKAKYTITCSMSIFVNDIAQ
jgi:hypothetical protein